MDLGVRVRERVFEILATIPSCYLLSCTSSYPMGTVMVVMDNEVKQKASGNVLKETSPSTKPVTCPCPCHHTNRIIFISRHVVINKEKKLFKHFQQLSQAGALL